MELPELLAYGKELASNGDEAFNCEGPRTLALLDADTAGAHDDPGREWCAAARLAYRVAQRPGDLAALASLTPMHFMAVADGCGDRVAFDTKLTLLRRAAERGLRDTELYREASGLR